MDVSRYDFSSQKSFHQGLQYARSFGHRELEVEHVALAIIRTEGVDGLSEHMENALQQHLKQELDKTPKVYGEINIDFGPRLNQALDSAEESAGPALVELGLLWKCLQEHSKVMQSFFQGKSDKSTTPTNREKATQTTEKSQNTGKSSQEKNIPKHWSSLPSTSQH